METVLPLAEITKKSGVLPLCVGAVECCRCGFCCKQSACGAASYDHARGQCEELVDNDDGTYSCGIFDKIVAMPKAMWQASPAFGTGCCSGMNSDRARIRRRA